MALLFTKNKNEKKFTKKKKIDLFVLVLFPIIASIISLLFKVNFITGILLFFGIPSIYLSIKSKNLIKKTAIVAAIFSIFLLLLDYWATINKAWLADSMFPFKIFGIYAIEMILWQFLFAYFIIIFYEYFFDKGKNEIPKQNLKYFFMLIIVLFLLIVLQVISHIEIINYFYLWIGIILILVPIVIWFFFFQKPILKFIKAGAYFFVVYLIYELTALKLQHWTFPGNKFIGWVTLFNLSFPIEELIFWMALGIVGGLILYEFFADDKK